jgi:hypothetical protein
MLSELQNMIIYPFKNEHYVSKALSEKNISLDFLDISRKQSYEDFSNYSKPISNFAPDDFLILVSEQVDKELNEKHFIELHRVSQFGWYYDKKHHINSQIFAPLNSQKIDNLLNLNPKLRIDSFDKLRDDYEKRKALNIFSGGLALCYHIYNDDYINFFSKLLFEKSSIKINLSELDSQNESIILLQLLLIHNPNDSRINEKVFPQIKALHLLHNFLSISFRYFYSKNYTISDYLEFLSKEFKQKDELTIVNELNELNDLYVKKGISVTPKNKLIAATKQFIDIAKTESDKLRSFLEDDNSFSKTAIFLLGMLHLHDRLEEQFTFDNFIPTLVNILVMYTKEIKISDGIIEFELDKFFTEQIIFKKVENYLKELNQIRQLIIEYNKLRNSISIKTLNDILNINSENNFLKDELENSNKEKNELQNEKKSLEDTIYNIKNDIKSLQFEKDNLQNEKKSLEVSNHNIKDEIKKLQSEKDNLENDYKKLLQECESLKSQNNNLQSEKNRLQSGIENNHSEENLEKENDNKNDNENKSLPPENINTSAQENESEINKVTPKASTKKSNKSKKSSNIKDEKSPQLDLNMKDKND